MSQTRCSEEVQQSEWRAGCGEVRWAFVAMVRVYMLKNHPVDISAFLRQRQGLTRRVRSSSIDARPLSSRAKSMDVHFLSSTRRTEYLAMIHTRRILLGVAAALA